MNLLIVDDEELTRTGVISSINWNELGIDEIFQADDGINGLKTALIHKPEIILCDVRMPRMTGIEMLEQLEKHLPDSVPIFMSGYSDKEYLKAAIRLKAVNYIEKPLDPREIREAVLDAKNLYIHKLHSRRVEYIRSMEKASNLALHLTESCRPDSGTLTGLAEELSLSLTENTWFTSIIVKLRTSTALMHTSENEISKALEAFLKPLHMNCIHVKKRIQHFVFFVFGSCRPSDSIISAVSNFLKQQYLPFGDCLIAAGDSLCGLSSAYQSYTSAVILLQSGFFFPENYLLTNARMEAFSPNALPPVLLTAPEQEFAEALKTKNQRDCEQFQNRLFDYFYQNPTLLQNQVKDLYYKLFLTLESVRRQLQVTGAAGQDSIVDTIEQCFTYTELHHVLLHKTEGFFKDAEHSVQENPTIFLIKEYISQNYMNETLSVKDISAHVFLSTSYVCTFFKNETGQTLNQYLTEYRMEKAKQLLCDPRYKIAEISSKAGYADGNYFGKSFRKYSGLSPSEYREKMTR